MFMFSKELKRQQEVERLLNMTISKEKELQEIVELAAALCGTPTAMITLLDEDTQHVLFKRGGVEVDRVERSNTFCTYLIEQDDVMMIPDALLDDRFKDNPFVTDDPGIRFYAGSQLTTNDGYQLGSLCVLDQTPRELTLLQQQLLKGLAKQAMQLLDFDNSLQLLKQQNAEVKRSGVELRSYFDSSIDCHLLLGKSFEVLAFNKAWESYVCVTYRKALRRGEQMSKYLHPEHVDGFYHDYCKALSGTAVFAERKTMHADKEVWRIIKFEPAFDEDGKIIGVSVNSTDTTIKVAQGQTVLAQNKSLKEIAYIQSHELRRPVASILGLMYLLDMDGHVSRIKELQLMEEAVNELDEKIRKIVDFTVCD